jgi:uncharacterized protein (TIGR02466 family)
MRPLAGERLSVFGAPVVVFRVPEAEALNAELREQAYARERADPGLSTVSRSAYQSRKTLFDARVAGNGSAAGAERRLREWILAAYAYIRADVYSLATPEGWQPEDMDAWFNIHRPGGFYVAHNHISEGWHWSGVYYVQARGLSEREGGLVFEDRIYDHTQGPRPLSRVPLPASSPAPEVRLQPEPGKMICFPSSLYHRVEGHASDEDRISIAFDVRDADLRWPLASFGAGGAEKLTRADWLRHYFLGVYLAAVGVRSRLRGESARGG